MSEQLQVALAVYLANDPFTRSPMMRRVLRFLVEHECDGEGRTLTPYRVAVDAFGKPHDFDASATASVRVEMARLRRILAELRTRFPTLPGIAIPQGSYRPQALPPLRPADREESNTLTAPAVGPGIAVFRCRGPLDDAHAHLRTGIARLLYDELARQRWLHVVNAMHLEPDMPGFAEYCIEHYEC